MYPGKRAKVITFIVTHNCNLRCSYCYECNKGGGSMSFETAKKCIDMLFREDEKGKGYITPESHDGIILDFIGGEPLLEAELIDKTLDYFRSEALKKNHRWLNNYMITISSNGIPYFEEATQNLIKHNLGRINIAITIDGNQQLHDSCRKFADGRPSYEAAAAAFKDVVDKFGLKGTKLTIAPANVNYLFEACKDMIENFNLSSLQGNTVYEQGWDLNHARIFYYELKKLADWLIKTERWKETWVSFFDENIGRPLDPITENNNWCGGTGSMLAFDIDGTIYPCMRYSPLSMGYDLPLLKIGHCDTGIETKEEEYNIVKCLNCITRCSQSTQECIDCPIASGCAWCSAYNYEVFGELNKRATFICPMHKARVMATSYFYNTIYHLQGIKERFSLNMPKEWALEIIDEEEYKKLLTLANN